MKVRSADKGATTKAIHLVTAFSLGPVRRLRVGLYLDALEAVRATVPHEIPQKPRRWLGP